MRALIGIALIFALVIATPASGWAQSQSAQNQDEGISISTSEITLDVIVRDKKGRTVKDLSASDFEVLEDGVPQSVASFRLISRGSDAPTAPATEGPSTGGAPTAPTAPTAPASKPAVVDNNPKPVSAVALVFDRVSAESRLRAREAALKYVNEGLDSSDLVGVFVTDLKLRVLQPFTNDMAAVRRAVDGVGTFSTGNAAASQQDAINTLSDRQNTLSQTQSGLESSTTGVTQATGAAAQAAGAQIGANAAEQVANEMTLRSEETFQTLDHDQQGYATADRKSVV